MWFHEIIWSHFEMQISCVWCFNISHLTTLSLFVFLSLVFLLSRISPPFLSIFDSTVLFWRLPLYQQPVCSLHPGAFPSSKSFIKSHPLTSFHSNNVTKLLCFLSCGSGEWTVEGEIKLWHFLGCYLLIWMQFVSLKKKWQQLNSFIKSVFHWCLI